MFVIGVRERPNILSSNYCSYFRLLGAYPFIHCIVFFDTDFFFSFSIIEIRNSEVLKLLLHGNSLDTFRFFDSHTMWMVQYQSASENKNTKICYYQLAKIIAGDLNANQNQCVSFVEPICLGLRKRHYRHFSAFRQFDRVICKH